MITAITNPISYAEKSSCASPVRIQAQKIWLKHTTHKILFAALVRLRACLSEHF
jgi:hypothetical protein